jgi:predicted membrane protein
MGMILALFYTTAIAVIYLTVDYTVAKKRTHSKKIQRLEKEITYANDKDELLDLRKQAWGIKHLEERIDRKLDNLV